MAKRARKKAKVNKKPAKKAAPKVTGCPIELFSGPSCTDTGTILQGYRCSECLEMLGGEETYRHTWDACLKCDKVTCFMCTKRLICPHCKGQGTLRVCTHCNGNASEDES